MSPKRSRILQQFITAFFSSRNAAVLSMLFIAASAILLYAVYHQVSEAVRIDLPITDEISSVSGPSVPGSPEVLILNSYHVGQTFSDNETTGVIETLQKASPKIQYLIEYLDTKRQPKMDHFDLVRALFQKKYGTRKIPVVIVMDNPALEFALKYRSQLFRDSSIVFCGINGYTDTMTAGHANITGLAEVLDAEGTVKAALTLHPKTRTVFVVHDYTTTGLATRKEAEEQLQGMSGRVAFEYLENMTREEMTKKLRTLPADSVVLALSFSVFKDGEVVNHKNIAKLLGSNSPVPVYGLHQERLGYGIVGGSLLGGKMHGEEAARIALAVLSGKSVSDIPVMTKSPTKMMFDHTQIARFGIPADKLPPNSVMVNRPIPFIERHLYLVVSTILVILILVTGIVALVFTIMQRISAQETVQRQVVELEAKNAELERFTYTVSHDLKSPLITIKGFLGMLVSDAKAGKFDRMESDIRRIENAANRMQLLLDDLLELSRIGRIVNPPAMFSMVEVAKEAEELVHGAVKAEGVEVVIDPGMPDVYADKQRIREVLQNLIENAIKFRGTGTLRIEIACRTGAGNTVYFVRDNGIGIDPKFHQKIFGLFDKLDPASSGTGIGLALVKRIVELHGGKIWVESDGVGKGSTFCFTLLTGKAEKKAA